VRVTNDPAVTDGFQAITSLSRSLGGRVQLNDVGSLLWVVLRQMVPILDLGFRVSTGPVLRSSVTVPLIDNGRVVAVLSLYSQELLAFTDEQATLLELLGPRLALSLADAAKPQILPTPEPRTSLRLAQRAT
jgi:GAF domain-containing protein